MIEYYGYKKDTFNLAIPCKPMAGVKGGRNPKIGSAYCQRCTYCGKVDKEEQTVECFYGER